MNSNNSEAGPVIDINIGRNWPEQIIVDHAPYWRAWRKQATCKYRMEDNYLFVGRVWIPFANGKNIGPQLMIDWMQAVMSRVSRKKCNKTGFISNGHAVKYRAYVKSYLTWLYTVGAIEVNPSDCLPKVRSPVPAEKTVYTHEEYLRMVAYGEEHAIWTTHLWILMLGYHTGMSLVDCCTLQWNMVDLPEDGPCFIKRIRTKLELRYGTKASCTIPIIAGSELWRWFKGLQRRYLAEMDRRDGTEFVHQQAANFSLDSFVTPTVEMNAFIEAALGKDRNGRTFRHLRDTFCSRLINAGVDSIVVSKMTGHQKVTQLAVYVVPDQTTLQNALLKGIRHVESKTQLPEKTLNQEGSCS